MARQWDHLSAVKPALQSLSRCTSRVIQQSDQKSKMYERRIVGSYVAAIIVPLCLGFWLNGVGHFVIGRFKRGAAFLSGSLALEFLAAFFLVALPAVDFVGYTLPWAEYEYGLVEVETLWPGIILAWIVGFPIWIWQILDLRRLNEALMKGKEKA